MVITRSDQRSQISVVSFSPAETESTGIFNA